MPLEADHAESTRSRRGELQRAKGWGKPLELNDSDAATPVELRTSYKILKDAGCVPAEVEAIRELAALRLAALEPDTPAWRGKQAQIQQKTLNLALQLKRLRNGS